MRFSCQWKIFSILKSKPGHSAREREREREKQDEAGPGLGLHRSINRLDSYTFNFLMIRSRNRLFWWDKGGS